VQHADGWLIQRIPAEYVYRIGPHTVLVADTVAVDLGPPLADQRWFALSNLLGLEVMTEGGDRVGRIADAELDDQSLVVTSYVLKGASGAYRRRGRVRPDEVLTFSTEMMIVKAPQPT